MGIVIEDRNLGVATVLSVEALINLFDAASWNYPWSAAGQVAYSFNPGDDAGRPARLSTWIFGLGVTATYR